MVKKVIIFCFLLLSLTSISYSQTTQMAITGMQSGLTHQGIGGTFLGIHGIYNTRLISDVPISSLGIVGMANYYSGKTRHRMVSITPTAGFYFRDHTLIHFGMGLYHDSLYKYGIASNVMLTGLMNDPLSNTKVFCSLYFQLSRAGGRPSMHFGFAISSGHLF